MAENRNLQIDHFSDRFLVGLLAACGCNWKKPDGAAPKKVTSEDVRRDVDKALDTAGEYSQQKKEEFQIDLEARLAKLDTEVAKLREQGRDLKDDAKLRWEHKMSELELKREAVAAKLAEVGNATAEAWKDVKKGAQSAWDDLDRAFHEAAKEF